MGGGGGGGGSKWFIPWGWPTGSVGGEGWWGGAKEHATVPGVTRRAETLFGGTWIPKTPEPVRHGA